jgi:hypothetical protein
VARSISNGYANTRVAGELDPDDELTLLPAVEEARAALLRLAEELEARADES